MAYKPGEGLQTRRGLLALQGTAGYSGASLDNAGYNGHWAIARGSSLPDKECSNTFMHPEMARSQ